MVTVENHEVNESPYGTYLKVIVKSDNLRELEEPVVFDKIAEYLKSKNIFQFGYSGIKNFFIEDKDGNILNPMQKNANEDVVYKAQYNYLVR